MIARRWVVRGAAATCALAAGAGVGVALAGSGGLDPSFGTGGTTVLERHVSTYPTPTRLAAGGKIVVATTSEGVITVSRLLANGAPDPTFDGDGMATIESAGFPSAHALAIQPDGKILLIGFTNIGGSSEDATVWRLKADGGSGAPNGALDPTFGSGGTVQIATFTHTLGLAVAVQPDGKIVAAGRGFNTTGPNVIAVWRLTESGSLDSTFDTDGVAGVSDTSEDSVNAIALAPDGKILIAGTTELSSAPRDAVVWRLKANGGAGGLNEALDPTFDTDGQADFDSGGNDEANDVAIQPDGSILLAGASAPTAGKSKATVWRVKPNGGTGVTNGALDPTFDTDGVALSDGGGSASGSAMALQPDGKVLLAGSAQVGANPSTAMLWRLLAGGGTGAVNGALDPSFGTGGATAVNTGSGAGASALGLLPDRRIVAAGGELQRLQREPARVPSARRSVRRERREGRHGGGVRTVLAAGHRLRVLVLGTIRRRLWGHADRHRCGRVRVRGLVRCWMHRGRRMLAHDERRPDGHRDVQCSPADPTATGCDEADDLGSEREQLDLQGW
jgi:uncharacterized delta-60 repeat protein